MPKVEAVHVLFVCLGNICRSPTAEGVFRHLCEGEGEGIGSSVTVDSAGTAAYHIGKPPDERAQAAALQRGIDLSGQSARRVVAQDFDRFDYILAMDEENLQNLRNICPPQRMSRVSLFLDFAPGQVIREVPDPYYGGEEGFEMVLDLAEAASRGLIDEVRRRSVSR